MSTITVQTIQNHLTSLAEDDFPEDVIVEGSPDQAVTNVVVCWFANRALRSTVERIGADLVIMHEQHQHQQANCDKGCRPWQDWPINREAAEFYRSRGTAIIRCHRTLDAYCIPRDFGNALGLAEPVVHTGHAGYEFTLVYDVEPTTISRLAEQFKAKLNLPMVRISGGDQQAPVRRIGSGWGGVSLSANLQYIELLREHGVDTIIGGEVDEYALEYYRDAGLRWIELGHYASEIIGLRRVARELATAYPSLRVHCHEDDSARFSFV